MGYTIDPTVGVDQSALMRIGKDVKLIGVFSRREFREASAFAKLWRERGTPRPNRPDLIGRYRVFGPDAQRVHHMGSTFHVLVVTVKHPRRGPERKRST